MDQPDAEALARLQALAAAAADISLVDTHAHIDGEEFDKDRETVVQRAAAVGVERIINMGDTMASSARSVQLTQTFSGLYAGVGVHPEEAFPLTAREDQQLADWAALPKVVAIGEIGLDYYWVKDEQQRALQREIFIRQLDLARQLHLPVCIHDREAHGDTLAILRKEAAGVRGVLHCYSGSWETAQELLRLGFFLGVDGPLTFKKAAKAPEIVQKMPLDMLLVETDCPYMAPVPLRGTRNEPSFVRFVAEKAAEIRHISLQEFAKQTTENASNLYGI
jgi:TatD DNase family protein